MAGEPIAIRNPSATRPWQHVLEPLSGYLLLASSLYEEPRRWGGSWNFGPSTREIRTVRDVAEVISYHLGRGHIEIDELQECFHEAQLLQLNCEKAQNLLGWSPRWDADKSLEATALWYKDMIKGDSVQQITRNQILSFFPELT